MPSIQEAAELPTLTPILSDNNSKGEPASAMFPTLFPPTYFFFFFF